MYLSLLSWTTSVIQTNEMDCFIISDLAPSKSPPTFLYYYSYVSYSGEHKYKGRYSR